MLKRLVVAGWICVISLILVDQPLAAERLRLSTTTSTENSGLLKALLPVFERSTTVRWM